MRAVEPGKQKRRVSRGRIFRVDEAPVALRAPVIELLDNELVNPRPADFQLLGIKPRAISSERIAIGAGNEMRLQETNNISHRFALRRRRMPKRLQDLPEFPNFARNLGPSAANCGLDGRLA